MRHTRRTKDNRREGLVRAFLHGDSWVRLTGLLWGAGAIRQGQYGKAALILLEEALLIAAIALCAPSIMKLTTLGTVRPDMGEGCPERFDLDFLKWVWGYNRNHREQNYRLLNESTHAQTIVLKNRRAVKRFLNSL